MLSAPIPASPSVAVAPLLVELEVPLGTLSHTLPSVSVLQPEVSKNDLTPPLKTVHTEGETPSVIVSSEPLASERKEEVLAVA